MQQRDSSDPEASLANPDLAFEHFLGTLDKTTNETQVREAFITLAAKGFQESELATDLALGAEYKVRFQSSGLVKRGAVDSFFGNLIIEFEYDLQKTGEHARDQLRAYVAGAWTEDKSAARPYLAVATDGRRWEIHSPRLADAKLPVSAENIALGEPIEIWEPTGHDDSVSLREFLNRLFFRKTLLKPSAKNFARDFGLSSPAFVHARAELTKKLQELQSDPQLQVLQGAWKTSLQIAYGSVDTDDELFAKHTYLAVLARLLVWTAFERRAIKTAEVSKVLSGLYFRDRIANLVEDDFFHWYSISSGTDASPLWIALSKQLVGYDLGAVSEDILKPLYEELVDPETKHELGEFYTPDWLASLIVKRIISGYDWKKRTPSILDPSCGSGTFVRTAIEAVRRERKTTEGSRLLDDILSCVMGIDVHPLAVIISRATYLIAIQDLLKYASEPITVPVFLANSLSMAPIQRDLVADQIDLQVDGSSYPVPTDFVLHGVAYDAAIEEVLQVGRAFGKPSTSLKEAPASFAARIGSSLNEFDKTGELVKTLGEMAGHIASLIRQRRNSVHGFLLKNHYRPSMLRGYFDFIVGNPPWLTVGQIATLKYKQTVIQLATDTAIASRSAGEQSHTELATVFLAVAVGNFLSDKKQAGPRVGLVMPRSLLTARHHRQVREGGYKQPFDIVEIWDLDRVTPLFNVPACVLFVAAPAQPKPSDPKAGQILSGRLPEKDLPVAVALPLIKLEQLNFKLAFLGKRSAWVVETEGKGTALPSKSQNAYVAAFRQGAVLYPQTLLVVRPHSQIISRSGTVRVKTDKEATENAKKSKDIEVDHIVDTRNVFLTAAGDHILPYTLSPNLWHVILPTVSDPGDDSFAPVDADELRKRGLIHTAEWLDWAENQWAAVRKDGDKTNLAPRLDTFGQLSAGGGQQRHLVLYTAAGKRPVAAVIDTKSLPLPFVARDRTYWGSFSNGAEAHYVCAFLNSDYAANTISAWMNRGLFGPRDINKRVLDVRWPTFDPTVDEHKRISTLAKQLATQAKSVTGAMPKGSLGNQRTWVRKSLSAAALTELEVLAKKISDKKK